MTVPAPVGVGRIKFGRWLVGGVALIGVLSAFAYMNRTGSSSSAQRGLRSTAAPVRVAVAERRDVSVVERTIGTVLPNTAVQVTARVQGVIDAAHFQEGQFVKAGMLLFEIDPRPYAAALAQAKAQLAKDQAQLQNAVNNEKRLRSVYEQKLTSLEQLDAAVAATGGATASVAADQAAIDIAQLNLEYTRSARRSTARRARCSCSRATRREQPTAALVTINQIRPIEVTFAVPERDLPRIRRALARAAVQSAPSTRRDEAASERFRASCRLHRQPRRQRDRNDRLSATFPTSTPRCGPASIVSVSLELGEDAGRDVVPREGRQTGQQGSYAYVVKADDKVDPRLIKRATRRDVVVDRRDLRPGERVVTRRPAAPRAGRGVEVDAPKRGRRPRRSHVMNISRLFIGRPVMTTLVMAAILIFGVVGYSAAAGRATCRTWTSRRSRCRRACPAPTPRRWPRPSRRRSRGSSRRSRASTR